MWRAFMCFAKPTLAPALQVPLLRRAGPRQSYMLPAAGSGGGLAVEEQQDHLVLGTAVAAVLVFLLSYQVWRRCRAKARSQSRLWPR
jgi:hypothetical protein